ncbi:MAG TPA: phosphoenolpyruvate carboxylase [Thermoleophilaceae bacterium]
MESAAGLQAACGALLPGYEVTRREPERWAVLTRACLQRRPVARDGELGPAAAERFDQVALQLLLDPDADPGSLLVTEVERASDVLCALWLARRSGLFRPGSTMRGSAGTCSRLGLVPSFKAASLVHATYLLATLYANAAYKRHLAARGNTQRVLLDSADGETHQRLARQARSWGVELSG